MWYDIAALNQQFTVLSFRERLRLLYRVFPPEEILVTSSFGTSSVFLLHMLSQIRPTQLIHFIDTGYHFPATLEYKGLLTDQFGLNIKDVHPDPTQHQMTLEEQMWSTEPDLCCAVNKVAALEPIKARHKVWISGVMGFQTPHRAGLQVFEQGEGLLKFHPFVDIDEGEVLYHFGVHKLPPHPLAALGYGSVGCLHCTVKGKGREGRWKGKQKTECGLHPGKKPEPLQAVTEL